MPCHARFEDHSPLAIRLSRRAWAILADGCALHEYGELAPRLGPGIGPRVVSDFLSPIQSYCAEHGLPPLQALVVNKATRRPGGGYTGDRTKRGHLRDLKRVRAYAWAKQAPY